ncbi:MAG TPA: helix-turn-helix domain-containing protein [Steroidobacteraceae bacterium]|nr:helix-turn-helix domain-containing protein [Steroidobacteraceae bacterium]
MEVCRTTGLATRGRLAAWTAHFCAQFDHAEIVPANLERFDAGLQTGQVGTLRFARLSCLGSAIDRSRLSGTAAAAHSYSLIAQLRGSGTLSQYGQVACMEAGDLALCDDATPHSHYMAECSELILLRIPSGALRAHLPSPEQFCGRRLPGDSGTTSAAATLVANLCRHTGPGLPPTVQDSLAHQLLELIAVSYTLAFDTLIAPSSVVGGRYAKARRFIEQQLRDPELGPQKIAGALNVSSRYLRMIFAGEKDSVSAYILRRRLEEVAHQLADARWRGRSISEIAFAWGFNSAPHFSRSFRERYGMSPREYRARRGGFHGQLRRNTLATAG